MPPKGVLKKFTVLPPDHLVAPQSVLLPQVPRAPGLCCTGAGAPTTMGPFVKLVFTVLLQPSQGWGADDPGPICETGICCAAAAEPFVMVFAVGPFVKLVFTCCCSRAIRNGICCGPICEIGIYYAAAAEPFVVVFAVLLQPSIPDTLAQEFRTS